MIDVDALSQPLPGAEPAGANLEYDDAFVTLEHDARGKAEQQFGDTLIAAREPDWTDIARRCAQLLTRSRDLRLACLLARAQLRTDGLAGLANALRLLDALCDRMWTVVHPQLDADDTDAIVRVNAMAVLSTETQHAQASLLRDLRAAPLASARGIGAIVVRQAEACLGVADPASADAADAPNAEQIEGAIRDQYARTASNPARDALAAAQALSATLQRHGAALDLQALIKRLQPLAQLFDKALGRAGAVDAAPAELDAPEPIRRSAGGPIGSREDALHWLERVCEYLERNEPTNPAPLLIRRAKRMMTMPFVELVNEMAPEAMESIRKIAGIASEPNS